MPSAAERFEDRLVDLFLSEYQDGSWAGPLSARVLHDHVVDGGVEILATRLGDGQTLAIEHTLIEPFVGEKADFHNHFKELQRELRADASLRIPGYALYVNAPVDVLPFRTDRRQIVAEIASWLKSSNSTFPEDWAVRDCPSPTHPLRKLTFQVRLQPLGGGEGFLIVQRYGEMRIGDSVNKALTRKLPKLSATSVDIRILMLERDQAWIDPSTIHDELGRLQPQHPSLAAVSEVWIADTGSFDDTKEWVEFTRRERGQIAESIAFLGATLHSRSRQGVPMPVKRSA